MGINKEQFNAVVSRIFSLLGEIHKELRNLQPLQSDDDSEVDINDMIENSDLCQLLKVSKRTLQRYRSEGLIKYYNIRHKIYYRNVDVLAFIRDYFKR